MFTDMKWSELINTLMQDFRLSSVELEKTTGVSNAIISQLKTGRTKKPTQHTIKKLEEGLQIRIDDSDPENITYKRIEETEAAEFGEIIVTNKFPIINTVYAGGSDKMFNDRNILDFVSLPYKKTDRAFALRVQGESINGLFSNGDIVLVDMDQPYTDKNIVVVRTTRGEQYIKRFKRLNESQIMLYSDNSNYEPVILSSFEIEAIYRVVGIWRDV